MNIDYAKRRRVMERSQLLGHCICDVRRPCPCDLLREKNLCPCAGERPEPADLSQVKLMDFARNAGCASKISPAELDAVLARLPAVDDPAVVSGLAAADDAAIYRLSENLYLVQTVDVFTPCVDDPRLFGRICAANCLSDVYAMGGTPRTALSVLAFPSETLPGEMVFQMLAGAMETFKEAGVALVGGHSIKDDEIKLGFAITGLIDPAVAAGLEKPAAGDVLVLSKPLGTGVLTFARQIGRECPEGLAAAELSMAALNRAASEAMREAAASACTDVTGFGLFAHLRRMLRPSGLGAEIFAGSLPALPGAIDSLRQGIIPGAIERNREYAGEGVRVAPGVDEARVNLGFDAQTSGGLLMAIPAGRLEVLRQSLTRRGVASFIIGKVTEAANGEITVFSGDQDGEHHSSTVPDSSSPGAEVVARASDSSPGKSMNAPIPNSAGSHEGCCADMFQNEPASSSAAESQKTFGALMRSVQDAGALDEKTKELILFSLVVASRCEPCFATHFRKAREMGLTAAQLDEAAWCAIAMGGAPVRMFYQESLRRVQNG
jgi:selenide,water dikinase